MTETQREGYPARMDCIINGAMFLRSNGNLVCWDDTGCDHVLQAWDPHVDYGTDVFLGRIHEQVRDAMRAGRMPFDACRAGCLALRPDATFDPNPVLARRVNYFQVESSFACQLACPNCYPGVKRSDVLPRTDAGQLSLDPSVLQKILEDFARASIAVELLEFQGHGEPLINRKIWGMIRSARVLQPFAKIKVVTNANFDFEPDMAASGVSEMVFSIDGVDDPSYLPYRVKGNFERAYAFMHDFCHAVHARDLAVHTVWKYVLFRHDDSEAQLLRLAELAEAAKVDEVQLIVTQMGDTSQRFLRAFSELQAAAAESQQVAELVSRLRFSVGASEVDRAWRQRAGHSPLPEKLVQLRRPRVSLFSYATLERDLERELADGERLLGEGAPREAGDALCAFAHRLWRLYDGRYPTLTDEHAALITRALSYLGGIPAAARYATLLKLDVFAPFLPRTEAGAARSTLTFWFHPISQVEQLADGSFQATGDDPQLALFAANLRPPRGRVTARVRARTLEGDLAAPRLYVDCGSGFSEDASYLLHAERLGDLSTSLDLPDGIRRLRFDPATGPGRFVLEAFELEPASA